MTLLEWIAAPFSWTMRGASAFSLGVVAIARICFPEPFIFPLGLYVFLLPFDTALAVGVGSEDSPIAITKYLAILAIVAMCASARTERSFRSPDPVVLTWIALFLLCVSSLAWSIEPEYKLLANHSGNLILYLTAAAYVPSESQMRKLKMALLYGGVFACLVIIVTYLFLGVSYRDTGRASLTVGENTTDPNDFCFCLAPAIALCLSFCLQSKGRKRLYYQGLMLIFVAAVALTRSRGGTLGLVVIGLVMFRPRFRLGKLIFFSVVVLGVIALIMCAAPEQTFEPLVEAIRAGAQALETHKLNPRVYIWVAGFHAFKDHWLFGVGVDNFPYAFHEYRYLIAKFYNSPELMIAHNILVQVAVELGVVGILFLGYVIRRHYRLLRTITVKTEDRWLLAALLGGLAQTMFLSVLWRKSFWLLWVLILLQYNWVNSQRERSVA